MPLRFKGGDFSFKLLQFRARSVQQRHLHFIFFTRHQAMLGERGDKMLPRIFFKFTRRRILYHRIEFGSELVQRI